MAQGKKRRFLKKLAKHAAEAALFAAVTEVMGPVGGAAGTVILKVIKKL